MAQTKKQTYRPEGRGAGQGDKNAQVIGRIDGREVTGSISDLRTAPPLGVAMPDPVDWFGLERALSTKDRGEKISSVPARTPVERVGAAMRNAGGRVGADLALFGEGLADTVGAPKTKPIRPGDFLDPAKRGQAAKQFGLNLLRSGLEMVPSVAMAPVALASGVASGLGGYIGAVTAKDQKTFRDNLASTVQMVPGVGNALSEVVRVGDVKKGLASYGQQALQTPASALFDFKDSASGAVSGARAARKNFPPMSKPQVNIPKASELFDTRNWRVTPGMGSFGGSGVGWSGGRSRAQNAAIALKSGGVKARNIPTLDAPPKVADQRLQPGTPQSEKLIRDVARSTVAEGKGVIPMGYDRARYGYYAPRHGDSLVPKLFIQGGIGILESPEYGDFLGTASSSDFTGKLLKRVNDGAGLGAIGAGTKEQMTSTQQFREAWFWENVDELFGGSFLKGPRNSLISFDNFKSSLLDAVPKANAAKASQIAARLKADKGRDILPQEYEDLLNSVQIKVPEINTLSDLHGWLMGLTMTDGGNLLREAAKPMNSAIYGIVPWQDVGAGYIDPRLASEKTVPTQTILALTGFDTVNPQEFSLADPYVQHGSYNANIAGRGLGIFPTSGANPEYLLKDASGNMRTTTTGASLGPDPRSAWTPAVNSSRLILPTQAEIQRLIDAGMSGGSPLVRQEQYDKNRPIRERELPIDLRDAASGPTQRAASATILGELDRLLGAQGAGGWSGLPRVPQGDSPGDGDGIRLPDDRRELGGKSSDGNNLQDRDPLAGFDLSSNMYALGGADPKLFQALRNLAGSTNKDFNWLHRFASPLSIVDGAGETITPGSYEKIAGRLGRQASDVFRRLQSAVEAGQGEASSLRSAKASLEYLYPGLEGEFPGLVEELKRHIAEIESEFYRVASNRARNPKLTEDERLAAQEKATKFVPYVKPYERAAGTIIGAASEAIGKPVADPDFAIRRTVDKVAQVNSILKLKYNIKSSAVNLVQPLETLWPRVSSADYAAIVAESLKPSTKKRLQDLGVLDGPTKIEGELSSGRKAFADPELAAMIQMDEELMALANLVDSDFAVKEAAGEIPEGAFDEPAPTRVPLTMKEKLAAFSPFSAASGQNRAIGYLYGEMDARRKGIVDPAQVHANGLAWAEMVEFDNSIYNMPPIMRDTMARLLLQYKGFTIKAVENLSNLLASAKTPQERAARLAKWSAQKAAVGGVKALSAPLSLVGIGSAAVYFAAKERAKDAGMEEDEAERLAQALYYGAPAMMGADLSSSTSMLDEPFGNTTSEQTVNFLAGPTVGSAITLEQMRREGKGLLDMAGRISPYVRQAKGVAGLVDDLRGNRPPDLFGMVPAKDQPRLGEFGTRPATRQESTLKAFAVPLATTSAAGATLQDVKRLQRDLSGLLFELARLEDPTVGSLSEAETRSLRGRLSKKVERIRGRKDVLSEIEATKKQIEQMKARGRIRRGFPVQSAAPPLFGGDRG